MVVKGQGQEIEVPRRNPYAMEVDRGKTITPAKDSGIWLDTIGIGNRKVRQ